MTEILDHEYALLIIGAFALFWLVWLPRILAPLIMPYYDKVPIRYKSIINLIMPTLERAILESWDYVYYNHIEVAYQETKTELDDKVIQEIDRRVREYFTSPDKETPPPTDTA